MKKLIGLLSFFLPIPLSLKLPGSQAASALVFGKNVTVETYGHDKYKRTIGEVFLPDGTNVNHTLD